MDDTEVLLFDSNTPNPRVQPRMPRREQPWLEQEDPEFWAEQTWLWKQCEQISRAKLNNLRDYYNQSKDGERRWLGPRTAHVHTDGQESPQICGSERPPGRCIPGGARGDPNPVFFFHSIMFNLRWPGLDWSGGGHICSPGGLSGRG